MAEVVVLIVDAVDVFIYKTLAGPFNQEELEDLAIVLEKGNHCFDAGVEVVTVDCGLGDSPTGCQEAGNEVILN